MKKALIRCCFFLFLLSALPLFASAADTEGAYAQFLDGIPTEVAELLPEGMLDAPLAESEQYVREGGGVRAVLRTVGRVTGLSLQDALSLLAKLCGVLLLAAVLRALSPAEAHGAGAAYSLLSTLALSLLLLAGDHGNLNEIRAYFDTVRGLCAAFLPLMGTLLAMGGNVRAAAVNHSVMSTFLSLLELLCSSTVVPVAGLCLSMAILDTTASGAVSLRPISSLIKRTYTLSLSFLMLLLAGVLGMQSTLAHASDSLALRTARFAAGSFLPVVGGSVAQTLGTVASSVRYLRGVAGSGAILVLFFVFLPAFLRILLTRTVFLVGGSIAGMLRCEREGKLLAELGSVYGYFLAVISSVFVMLTFSLTLFARCATAMG